MASWYPNKADTLTGDFIERHARAASLHNNITVLFVTRDISLLHGQVKRESRNYNNNCSAEIIYYGAGNSFYSAVNYFKWFNRLIKEYIQQYGRPHLIHVHVVFRAGLIALYARYKYGIKYLITEHWSLFNDAAPVNFNKLSFIKKRLIRRIYRGAEAATAVSHHLSSSIKNKTGITAPLVIPNVFDATLFYPEEKDNEVFRFIHISQLNYAKNAEQIIEAAEILYQQTNKKFRLTIFGPYHEHIDNKINKSYTDYYQEIPQAELAIHLRRHHALILYSRYEGLPCVVIEALASGIPAIVSDIPSMHELVEENVNGSIVQLNNPQLLAKKMQEYVEGKIQFNTAFIAATASKKYSFEAVGKQFDDVYNAILNAPKRVR